VKLVPKGDGCVPLTRGNAIILVILPMAGGFLVDVSEADWRYLALFDARRQRAVTKAKRVNGGKACFNAFYLCQAPLPAIEAELQQKLMCQYNLRGVG